MSNRMDYDRFYLVCWFKNLGPDLTRGEGVAVYHVRVDLVMVVDLGGKLFEKLG